MLKQNRLIVIIGPTATGKTKFAVALAHHLDAEIISADSRQVYKYMNIGTGKDLEEYNYNGCQIPYHLIDIVEPGYEYNVYEYQRDFYKIYKDLCNRGKQAVLCGGSGMYIDAVLRQYNMAQIELNIEQRLELEEKTNEELIQFLESKRKLHNITDTLDRKRLIRAIEVVLSAENQANSDNTKLIPYVVFGIAFDREVIRQRISVRLKERLCNGMIDEVQNLLRMGYTAQQLMFYGLEYKFITQYLINQISYSELEQNLAIAIHQFAKRQMTWFRRMEKKGVAIIWLDGNLSHQNNIDVVIKQLEALER